MNLLRRIRLLRGVRRVRRVLMARLRIHGGLGSGRRGLLDELLRCGRRLLDELLRCGCGGFRWLLCRSLLRRSLLGNLGR